MTKDLNSSPNKEAHRKHKCVVNLPHEETMSDQKPNKKLKIDRNLSRSLSWLLRHSAPSLKLAVSSDGYVPISAILTLKVRKFNTYTEEDICRVAHSNDKQRFRVELKRVTYSQDKSNATTYVFSGGEEGEEVSCIRANQGHSIPGICFDELLTAIPDHELKDLTIIHGTYTDRWNKNIRKEGLSKMNRNHIHFAAGLPSGEETVISGMRKTCQVYIYIDGASCAQDGIKFYRSDNGVILSAGAEAGILSCRHFARVVDAESGKEIKYESDL